MFVKTVIEAIDPQTNSISWNVIEGNLLDLYNSFTVITSSEHEWITYTLVYEKKTEDTPEPLALMHYCVGVIKDTESHLLKN